MKISSVRKIVLGAVSLLSLMGSAWAQGKCEDPKVLKFSLVPTQDSVRELSYYKPVLDQLSKNTGKKIEFYMPTSYSSVIEALLGKWVDVAVLGPERRREREGDVDPVLRQEARRAVRPLQQHDRFLRQILEAELG